MTASRKLNASTEPSVAKTDRRFFPLYTQEENPYDNADTTPRYRC